MSRGVFGRDFMVHDFSEMEHALAGIRQGCRCSRVVAKHRLSSTRSSSSTSDVKIFVGIDATDDVMIRHRLTNFHAGSPGVLAVSPRPNAWTEQ